MSQKKSPRIPRKISKKIPKFPQKKTVLKRKSSPSKPIQHEGYNYWGASDPEYFNKLRSESVGSQCWHLNPCEDRNFECVVGRGTGYAIVNGLRYPKGHCVIKEDINL